MWVDVVEMPHQSLALIVTDIHGNMDAYQKIVEI
jgi:hypothetical protein